MSIPGPNRGLGVNSDALRDGVGCLAHDRFGASAREMRPMPRGRELSGAAL